MKLPKDASFLSVSSLIVPFVDALSLLGSQMIDRSFFNVAMIKLGANILKPFKVIIIQIRLRRE
jgi:hypothetical protein